MKQILDRFYVYGFDDVHHSHEDLLTSKKDFSLSLTYMQIPNGSKVYLSTCNREEVYFLSEAVPQVFDKGYLYRGIEAYTKLLYTMLGLNTAIFADSQILSQIKRCVKSSQKNVRLDEDLKKIFSCAFGLAKKVEEEVELSKYESSVARIFFEKILNGRSGYESIAIVGTGLMAQEFLGYLKSKDHKFVSFFGRNPLKVIDLERKYKYPGKSLSDLIFDKHDIVVFALQLKSPIFFETDFKNIVAPLILLDLGVPNNVKDFKKDFINIYNLKHITDVESIDVQSKRHLSVKVKSIINSAIFSDGVY